MTETAILWALALATVAVIAALAIVIFAFVQVSKSQRAFRDRVRRELEGRR